MMIATNFLVTFRIVKYQIKQYKILALIYHKIPIEQVGLAVTYLV